MSNETAARAATASTTSEVKLTCMDIHVEGVTDPLRFVFNDEDIDVDGETYLASGFQYKPPAQGTEAQTVGQLRVDNVDRAMSEAVRTLSVAPKIHLFDILASDPDVKISSSPLFTLFNISWNLFTMEGTLGLPDDADEPCVSYRYSPKEAPAIYAL